MNRQRSCIRGRCPTVHPQREAVRFSSFSAGQLGCGDNSSAPY